MTTSRCEGAGRAVLAHAQCSHRAVIRLLGYAEGAALVAAGAGATAARDTVELVRVAVRAAVCAPAPGWCPRVAGFPTYARLHVHRAIRERLGEVAASVAVGCAPRSTVRVGDLSGVARLAHAAGVAGSALRRRDRAVEVHALRLRAELPALLAPLAACGCAQQAVTQ